MQKALIRHLRCILGLSQQELSKRVGVHQSVISRIESGETTPKKETEEKLLKVFSDGGISMQDIVLLQGVFASRKAKGEG